MTLNIDPGDFIVPEGARVTLEKWPTHVQRAYKSKKEYHKLLDEQVDELTSLQRLHYASNGYAVLIIFQGLVIDKTAEDWPARIAATGLALAVYPVGVERGFISAPPQFG